MTSLDSEVDIRLTLFMIATFIIISCLLLILGITVCMITCKKDPEKEDSVTSYTGYKMGEKIFPLEDIILNYSLSEFKSIHDLFNKRFGYYSRIQPYQRLRVVTVGRRNVNHSSNINHIIHSFVF